EPKRKISQPLGAGLIGYLQSAQMVIRHEAALSHTRIANGRYPASGCVNPSVKVLATILRKELWKGAPISCTSCLPNLSISVRSCPPHMGHALPCIAALSASKTS